MSNKTSEHNLHEAIEHERKKITSLNIRRPIVADILAAQKVSANEPERELNLIAVLTGPPRVAGALGLALGLPALPHPGGLRCLRSALPGGDRRLLAVG